MGGGGGGGGVVGGLWKREDLGWGGGNGGVFFLWVRSPPLDEMMMPREGSETVLLLGGACSSLGLCRVKMCCLCHQCGSMRNVGTVSCGAFLLSLPLASGQGTSLSVSVSHTFVQWIFC